MTTKLHLGVGGYCGAELFRVRWVERVSLFLPFAVMNRAACFAGLAFEIGCRRANGELVPPAVHELVAADIENADECGDGDRLALIWESIPVMVGEALEHWREYGSLPI